MIGGKAFKKLMAQQKPTNVFRLPQQPKLQSTQKYFPNSVLCRAVSPLVKLPCKIMIKCQIRDVCGYLITEQTSHNAINVEPLPSSF